MLKSSGVCKEIQDSYQLKKNEVACSTGYISFWRAQNMEIAFVVLKLLLKSFYFLKSKLEGSLVSMNLFNFYWEIKLQKKKTQISCYEYFLHGTVSSVW